MITSKFDAFMYLSTLCIGNQHYFFSIHFSILCAKRKKKKSSSKMQKKKIDETLKAIYLTKC